MATSESETGAGAERVIMTVAISGTALLLGVVVGFWLAGSFTHGEGLAEALVRLEAKVDAREARVGLSETEARRLERMEKTLDALQKQRTSVGLAVNPRQNQPSTADVTPLVEAARRAFEDNEVTRGTAYLSAALNAFPDDDAALDLLDEHTSARLDVALEGGDWSGAQAQLSINEKSLDGALRRSTTVSGVEAIIARYDKLESRRVRLDEALGRALGALLSSCEGLEDTRALSAFETRLGALPKKMLFEAHPDKVKEALECVAATKARLALAEASEALTSRAKALDEEGLKPDELEARLFELERLLVGLRERDIRLEKEKLDKAREALEAGRARRDKAMRRAMDSRATETLSRAERVVVEVRACEKSRKMIWQDCLDLIAEGLRLLERIPAQSSDALQTRYLTVMKALGELHKTSSMGQLQRYNNKVVDKLAACLSQKEAGVNETPDNMSLIEEAFETCFGSIDTSLLFPMTYAYYNEIYSDIYDALDEDKAVNIRSRVVGMKKDVIFEN